ncbi:hypothetical protein [uncultured Bosea sp.]|uniref:hypothetical protein n=1 Tax=uncultured Bosea sp. TaxID=211457 RepID=UPI0025F8022C|nr:hypothetical protein [uncultured Bosea sp.]
MNAERYADRAKGFIQSARSLATREEGVHDAAAAKLPAGKGSLIFNGKKLAMVDEGDLELA